MKRIREKIREAIRRFTGDDDIARIARRYLVMNSFDGVLTILGVVVGTYLTEAAVHPNVILSAGFGVSLAMGISGFVGAYFIEWSERMRTSANGKEEPNSDVHGESLFLALVDGLSPALVTFIAISPFFLVLGHIISMENAFISSMVIILGELFGLGVFLGRIARRSVILHGLIALLVGLVTFLIVSMLPF
jgi:predicted membrane protein (TIGR00267 family)